MVFYRATNKVDSYLFIFCVEDPGLAKAHRAYYKRIETLLTESKPTTTITDVHKASVIKLGLEGTFK